jgi:hypothetical protein
MAKLEAETNIKLIQERSLLTNGYLFTPATYPCVTNTMAYTQHIYSDHKKIDFKAICI